MKSRIRTSIAVVAVILCLLSVGFGAESCRRGTTIIVFGSGTRGSLFLREGTMFFCTDPVTPGTGGRSGVPVALYNDCFRNNVFDEFLGFRAGATTTYWFAAIPFWAIILATGALSFYGVYSVVAPSRPRVDSKGGRCGQCGYDLRATFDRCPECGMELSRVRRAGGSVIYQNLLTGSSLPSKPCRKCGFDLAGVGGLQCPQCGERLLDNESSMLDDRLRNIKK